MRAVVALTTMEDAGRDRSYWARIVRKNCAIEYKYLKKETKDLEKLKKAWKKGDVEHVIMWAESEIDNTKIILESLFQQVKSALIMAHIQKENLHHLLQENKEIGARDLPATNMKNLKEEVLNEVNDIDDRLRRLGSMLTGESWRD